MEGIALRKTTLIAAGWEIRKDYGPYQVWAAYMPNGQVYFVEFSETRALEGCPAVESSVDAALQWLKLPDGYYWKFVGYVTGLVEPGWTAYICKGDDTKVNYIADAETMPQAMCQAYLEYKQRG